MAKITRIDDPVNLPAPLRAANQQLLALRQQRQAQREAIQETNLVNKRGSQESAIGAISPHTAQKFATLRAQRQVEIASLNSRLRQRITLNIIPDESLPVVEHTTIRVQPALLAAMLREERAAIGRIWLLCRHIDRQGRGWIEVEKLRATLTDKSSPMRVCGWRRLRQLLQEGAGILWERDDHGRLWLYGTVRIAQQFGLTYLQGSSVELPIKELLQTIGGVRASFYACFHAGRVAMPISRDCLEEITGVAARTQRDYDQQCNVERVSNFAILDAQEKEVVHWEHGRAVFAFTDPTGDRRVRWACRLPNSYLAPYENSATNGTKPLNRQLRRDLAKHGTQGNTSTFERKERLYFTDGQQAAKQVNKQERLYLQGRQKKSTVLWNSCHKTTSSNPQQNKEVTQHIIHPS